MKGALLVVMLLSLFLGGEGRRAEYLVQETGDREVLYFDSGHHIHHNIFVVEGTLGYSVIDRFNQEQCSLNTIPALYTDTNCDFDYMNTLEYGKRSGRVKQKSAHKKRSTSKKGNPEPQEEYFQYNGFNGYQWGDRYMQYDTTINGFEPSHDYLEVDCSFWLTLELEEQTCAHEYNLVYSVALHDSVTDGFTNSELNTEEYDYKLCGGESHLGIQQGEYRGIYGEGLVSPAGNAGCTNSQSDWPIYDGCDSEYDYTLVELTDHSGITLMCPIPAKKELRLEITAWEGANWYTQGPVSNLDLPNNQNLYVDFMCVLVSHNGFAIPTNDPTFSI